MRREKEKKRDEERKGRTKKRRKASLSLKERRERIRCVVSGQATALAHTQSRQERKRSDRDAAVVHTAPND